MDFELDKATIMGRLGGDEDIFAALADSYLQDIEVYCAQLRSAQAAGDAPLLQREAHTVKGLLATFADHEGSALALEVECRARAGNCAGLEDRIGEVIARLRAVAEALRSEFPG